MGLLISLLLLLTPSILLAGSCLDSRGDVELLLCLATQEGSGTILKDYSTYKRRPTINGSVSWVPGVIPNRSVAKSNTSSFTAVSMGDWALSQPSVAGTGVLFSVSESADFDFTGKNFMVGYNFKRAAFPVAGHRAFLFYTASFGNDGWGMGTTNLAQFAFFQCGIANLDSYGQFSDSNPHRLFMIRDVVRSRVYAYLDGVPFSGSPFTLGSDMGVSAGSQLSVGYGAASSGNPYDGTWNMLAIYRGIPLKPDGGLDKNLLDAFAYNEYRSVMGYDSGGAE